MPSNVNDFFVFTNFCSNKAQSGNTIPPSRFNLVANQAQLVLFEKDFQTFLQTEEVSAFLSFFLKNQTISVPATGFLPYPSDYQHTASIRSYFVRPALGSTEIPVMEVKNSSWGAISTSQLQPGTKRFPKYSEFSDGIKFLPKNIGSVMLDYFKTPIAPVWGYTLVGSRPVYDAATSTDFEWDDVFRNAVAAEFLKLISINIKDSELAQFAEMFKQTTNSVL